jgi:hypothetical protein
MFKQFFAKVNHLLQKINEAAFLSLEPILVFENVKEANT